ncbi:MAG: hypothetical protein ABFD97_20260 [Syntrophobacter sp.]
MRLSEADEANLADRIYQNSILTYEETMANEYKSMRLKIPVKLTDPKILSRLRQRADAAARSVINTYHADLEKKLEVWGAKGIQPDIEMLKGWAKDRSRWKATQIGVSETAWTQYGATLDTYQRNGMDDLLVWVEPESAVCATCAQIVAGNPYTVEQARGLDLPVHISCPHVARADTKHLRSHEKPDNPWTGGPSHIPVDQSIGIPGNVATTGHNLPPKPEPTAFEWKQGPLTLTIEQDKQEPAR